MIQTTTEEYLCDISSKLYSSIINNGLHEWTERNSLTGECQANFKKDYSTVAICLH